MIEKIITPKNSLRYSKNTITYKFMVILMILDKYGEMEIGQLQIYLWGVENDDNMKLLKSWKKNSLIVDLPLLFDETLMALISQCMLNNLIKQVSKKTKTNIAIDDLNAHKLLSAVSDSYLAEEIDNRLRYIGKIPRTKIDNIQFDF